MRVHNGLMSGESVCYQAAFGAGVDPSGVPWAELDPDKLRPQRSSVKWTRYPADVLPMFVAEMDFAVAPEVRRALVQRIEASDTGYLDGPGPLAPAFADFARDRWGWEILEDAVHIATDVATGVVESLRVALPSGGRLVLPTPCYPGFFEMLQELNFEVVEVPLRLPATEGSDEDHAPSLDLPAIEREFASEAGATAFILCNPHNPHGVPFSVDELTSLARLSAEHGVFVVSDEIHAPLTHADATFTPFAPLAAAAGALAVTATSASKGWNLAGAKCSVIVAADERANRVLAKLPPEVSTRTSILGLHANLTAFTHGRDWLDRTVAQIEANQQLLTELVTDHLPGVVYRPGSAGYLAWLDLRGAGLGEHPAARILDEARVALNDGRYFGRGGEGFARLNLACAPDTIVRGIDRISALCARVGATA